VSVLLTSGVSGVWCLTYCRHLHLPSCSLLHWNPCIYDAIGLHDFPLRSLSPPQGDPILPPLLCQLDESGQMVYVTCKLDLSQFQNSFLRDKQEREEWTERQRSKGIHAKLYSHLVSHQDLARHVCIHNSPCSFAYADESS
jgi:hypothetical protein